jgi:hypothetical protein
MAPRVYGDKQRLEHSGPDGGPIETAAVVDASAMSSEERAQLRQVLLAIKARRNAGA